MGAYLAGLHHPVGFPLTIGSGPGECSQVPELPCSEDEELVACVGEGSDKQNQGDQKYLPPMPMCHIPPSIMFCMTLLP
jgi:hypothetical protein